MDVTVPESGDERQPCTINNSMIAGNPDSTLLADGNDATVADENDSVRDGRRGGRRINLRSDESQAFIFA
jgi:hypothetical protein